MKTLGLFEPMWMDGWMDEIMKAVVGVRFWKPNTHHQHRHHLPGWMKTLTWLWIRGWMNDEAVV
jgi:hypothetical protein